MGVSSMTRTLFLEGPNFLGGNIPAERTLFKPYLDTNGQSVRPCPDRLSQGADGHTPYYIIVRVSGPVSSNVERL